MGNQSAGSNASLQRDIPEEALTEIKAQLAQIQFGSLEIQIHNGQIVQLERREKTRWDKALTK